MPFGRGGVVELQLWTEGEVGLKWQVICVFIISNLFIYLLSSKDHEPERDGGAGACTQDTWNLHFKPKTLLKSGCLLSSPFTVLEH